MNLVQNTCAIVMSKNEEFIKQNKDIQQEQEQEKEDIVLSLPQRQDLDIPLHNGPRGSDKTVLSELADIIELFTDDNGTVDGIVM